MRIFTCGSESLISPAASIPDFFGMRTSMRITSGISSCARSTTSAPSAASPTSSRSGSCSRTICRPRRNSAWSSQTSTRSRSEPLPSVVSLTRAPRVVLVVRRRRDLGGFYATRPGDQASPPALMVVPDLALEPLGDDVDRGLGIPVVRVGAEGLPGRGGDDLDPVHPALPRVPLGDDRDLEAREPGFEALEAAQLVLGDRAQPLGDARSASLQDQLHPPSGRPRLVRGPRPADLVFVPTPACRDDRRSEGRLRILSR